MLCCVVFTKVAERLFELLLLRGRVEGGKFSNFVNSTTLEECFSEISPSL